jgi:hypothetical protein
LKTRERGFFNIQPGEGKISVRGFFDLGVFNLSLLFYCKKGVLVLIFSTMDRLDKEWLVFEAFGVNFPWKDIKELSEGDLDYLYNKADDAKKRHEAALELQKQQQAQQVAAMQQQQAGANIISPGQF